jgi:peroxiredoxin
MKSPAFWLLLVVVAAAGLAGGLWFRSARTPPPSDALDSPFAEGDVFPDVVVIDDAGQPRSTHEILGSRGGVVLFLDPDCPPCRDMSLLWQSRVADGEIGADRVLGVAPAEIEAVRAYRDALALSFSIYSDADRAFAREHGVVAFPLRVVVDSSLHVRGQSANPATEPRGDALRRLLGS